MKSYTFRSLIVGILISLAASAGILSVAGYSLLRLGASGLREVQSLSRARGMEAALAVSQMASEKFDDEMAMKLSSVMNEIVSISAQRNDSFQVTEMLMLRADGSLMAANEIARVARDSERKYSESEYTSALELPARSPLRVREVKLQPTAAAPIYNAVRKLSPSAGEWLARVYPEKIVSEYHVSVAVYPVDEELTPSGAVHLFARSTAANRFMENVSRYSVRTLILSLSLCFILTALTIFLLLVSFHGAAPASSAIADRTPAQSAGPPVEDNEAVLEEFVPESVAAPAAQSPPQSSAASPQSVAPRSRILDAIPLDPLTR
ncbi:MAG: hypothetical protein K1X75_03725 [Leptospirales bacterium]|nr:hypothetical protein [Leptospirales bacterium]